VIFKERGATIIESDGSTLLKATRCGDLYFFQPSIETAATAQVSDFQKWHLKFGHLNENDLIRLKSENMVKDLKFNVKDSLKDCKVCIQAKQTVKPFSKSNNFCRKDLLNVLYSDLCDPMKVPSHA
jgi:hypothetical protein